MRTVDLAAAGKLLAVGAVMALLATGRVQAAPLFPTDLSENTTGVADAVFLGAPDDDFAGIGGQVVTYDFGAHRVLNTAAVDINIYEVDFGSPEFTDIEVSVSLDGSTFFSITSTASTLVRIAGDNVHSADAFGRSYDIDPSGLSEIRYVRIDGDGSGPGGSTNAFDLDAIGAHDVRLVVAAVPEPGTLALIGVGALGLGLLRRRRA
jgi:hypothetical protein